MSADPPAPVPSRFQQVADAAPVMMWTTGPDGACDWVNGSCLAFVGRTLEQEAGYGWLDRVHPDDRERCRAVHEAAFAERRAYENEYRVMRADGEYRWILDRAVPRALPGGAFAGYVGCALDITERRRAEARARESEARFRRMADQAPVMIWMTDTGNRGTYFNVPWLSFTGRSMDEELGAGWASGIHPDDLERCLAFCQRHFEARRPFLMEFRLRNAAGEYRWVLDHGIPLLDGQGAFTGYIGSCIDITGRRQGEDAVRYSEQRYRSLVAATTSIVWSCDGAGDFTEPQESWSRYTGQSFEEYRAAGWAQAVHPADRDLVRAIWYDAVRGRTAYEAEYRLWHHPSRSFRHVVARGVPVAGADGSIPEWIGTVQDVHDQRRAQEGAHFLAEASQLLAASLDHEATLAAVARRAVPGLADWAGVLLRDEDGRTRRLASVVEDPALLPAVQEMEERLAALPAPSLLLDALRAGQPWFVPVVGEALLASLARDEADLALLRALGAHSLLAVPFRARGRLQGAFWFVTLGDRACDTLDLELARALADRAGMAVDNALLYREAQEANREAREASARAEEANRLKDDFLATLSHELRTPLNAIVGWSHMLRQAEPDPDTLRRGLETISRNAQIQTRIVSDILDVSRIMAGKLTLALQDVPLSPAVEAALEAVRPAAASKKVRLEAAFGPGAGSVLADPARLQQMVWNLVANAIKFSPPGGHVQVEACLEDGQVEIAVRDEGPGVHPDFQPHLFQRFRQADSSTTRSHGGLGLGLAIVRHLVELHGGSVAARNRAEGGAEFVVRLPCGAGDGFLAPAPAERTVRPGGRVLCGVRVLVVDDEPDALDFVASALRACGAEVLTAASAAEAFRSVQSHRPHVLLADVAMPGEDGYQLVRRIRLLPHEEGGLTPAAALTAHAAREDRAQALLAGFQVHVPKPVLPDELADVVAELAGRARDLAPR